MRITGSRLRKIIREVISEQNTRSEYLDPSNDNRVSDFISDMFVEWLELSPNLPQDLRRNPKYLFDYLKDLCLLKHPGFDMRNMTYVKERFSKEANEGLE